jgi:hypothetical protein
MFSSIRLVAIVVGAVLSIASSAFVPVAQAAPQDDLASKRYTVHAGVQSAPDIFIRAEQVTGPFTVPKGCRATSFKYHFGDPQTDYESDKLRAGNIRVIRGGYVGPDVGTAEFSLGPGDYVFVVGGLPGAVGTLSYVLERAESTDFTTEKGEHIIDVVTWSPLNKEYNPKMEATYRIREGKVQGEVHQTLEPPKYDNGVTCDPMRVNGTFTGTITDNVITGKWQTKTAPHQMHFPGLNGPPFDRTDSFTQTYESRLVLYSNATLSETMKGSGESEWEWGPTAPAGAPGDSKRGKDHYEFSVPGENHPQPMQGTWKTRN